MWKCLECGHLFEDGEEVSWTESYGEHFSGCPVCKCAYAEAYQCDRCRSYHLSDELYNGLCINCLIELATPHNIADWCDTDTILAEQFYEFYYDSLIANSSKHLRQLLRGGLLQRQAIDRLNNRRETADKCFEFINGSEEYKYEFSEWIKKGNMK